MMRSGQNNEISSPETPAQITRGKRLKIIRSWLDLTREELAKLALLNATTIKSWELGRYGGLTEKGAEKLILGFQKAGILCTVEWLYHGTGIKPQQFNPVENQNRLAYDQCDLSATAPTNPFANELCIFQTQFKNTIIYEVTDDSMLHYRAGDFVGGIKKTDTNAITQLLGKDCIVETTTGLTLLRRLQNGTQDGTYLLLGTNLAATSQPYFTQDNVTLTSAALVIRHYSKDS